MSTENFKRFLFLIALAIFTLGRAGAGLTAEPLSSAPTASSPVTSAPAASAAPALPNAEYVIGQENALQIDVYYGNNEKISQRVRVSSRGTINFPLVGDMQVAGLTVSEAQDRLTWMLGQDYLVNPQVTVYIEEYSTVSIMGEVNQPGAYPIKGRLTVVELISLAQGFTKIASPNKVKVIRINPDGTREEMLVRVSDLMGKDASSKENVELRSGDVVIVPESLF
jgi:polysaccharide biosynthesis/export protein